MHRCCLACSTLCSSSICQRAAPFSFTCSRFCSCCGGRRASLEGKQCERRDCFPPVGGRRSTLGPAGGAHLDAAASSALVGGVALAGSSHLLFHLSGLSRLRYLAPSHHSVRAFA